MSPAAEAVHVQCNCTDGSGNWMSGLGCADVCITHPWTLIFTGRVPSETVASVVGAGPSTLSFRDLLAFRMHPLGEEPP